MSSLATSAGVSRGNDVAGRAGSTWYAMYVDREKAAWEILDAARKQRYRWPRALWTWSFVIGAICLVAFMIALLRG